MKKDGNEDFELKIKVEQLLIKNCSFIDLSGPSGSKPLAYLLIDLESTKIPYTITITNSSFVYN